MSENKKDIRGFRGVGGVKITVRILTVFAALLCALSALASIVVYSFDMVNRSEDEIVSDVYSELTQRKAWQIFSYYVYGRGENVMEEGIRSVDRDFYLDIYYQTDENEKLVYSESEGKDHSFKYEFTLQEKEGISYLFRCFMKNELNENGELNVDEEVAETFVLAFPKKLLCSEDCEGLCPKCGKRKKDGDCGCVMKEIDPRLAVLKKLLDN